MFPHELLDPILSQMYLVLTNKDMCPFYICLVILPIFAHNSSFPPRRNINLEISTKILYDFLTILDTELCIKHFIVQLLHTNYKILRLLK